MLKSLVFKAQSKNLSSDIAESCYRDDGTADLTILNSRFRDDGTRMTELHMDGEIRCPQRVLDTDVPYRKCILNNYKIHISKIGKKI